MMFGRGYYGAGACGILGPLLMVGVVLMIALLVYFLLKSNKSKSSELKSNEAKPVESKFDDSYPIAILKEKFAKGEITEEEYLNKKNILERR